MRKGSHQTEESKLKNRLAHLGKQMPERSLEYRLKLSLTKLGDRNPSRRLEVREKLRTPKSEEHRKAISRSNKGRCAGDRNPSKRPDVRRKKSVAMIRLWRNSDFQSSVQKGLHQKQTRPEKRLQELLEMCSPGQWRFVGDFKFLIRTSDRTCFPDFIHNTRDLAIELFSYHHTKEVTGVPEEKHVQERIDLLKSAGYRAVVIWESELADPEKVIKRVKELLR